MARRSGVSYRLESSAAGAVRGGCGYERKVVVVGRAVDVDVGGVGWSSRVPSNATRGTTSSSRRVKWRRLSLMTGVCDESHRVDLRTRGLRDGDRRPCDGGCGFIGACRLRFARVIQSCWR